MKKALIALVSAALLLAFNSTAAQSKEKEVTIKGEAKCAHCMLHQGTECQTVIQSEKGGKMHTYYVVDNEVAKGFHDNVCQNAKKVVAKGTITKAGDKEEITLKSIKVASK